ncbi:hypothetical protein [Bacillus pseudomycoides]|uniref:hypothetical protein n=1 Tax=Bacillus pseudomycoides TaxID=64104 RepID=UPI001FB40A60
MKEWKQDFLRENEEYWIRNIPLGYDLKEVTPKEYIIEQLMNTFKQEIKSVYLVELDIGDYYACSYEDYVFITNKGIYYLSMQVHD